MHFFFGINAVDAHLEVNLCSLCANRLTTCVVVGLHVYYDYRYFCVWVLELEMGYVSAALKCVRGESSLLRYVWLVADRIDFFLIIFCVLLFFRVLCVVYML